MKPRYLMLMLLVLLSAGAWAGNTLVAASAKDGTDANAPIKDTKDVWIRHAWGYAPLPGQDKLSLEMEVTCLPSFCKLIGIQSKLAASGAMQRYWAVHGRMGVENITAVPMRRSRTMKFGPRTINLVLQGLKRPLKAGDHVHFTLLLVLSGKNIAVDGWARIKARKVITTPISAVPAQ